MNSSVSTAVQWGQSMNNLLTQQCLMDSGYRYDPLSTFNLALGISGGAIVIFSVVSFCLIYRDLKR